MLPSRDSITRDRLSAIGLVGVVLLALTLGPADVHQPILLAQGRSARPADLSRLDAGRPSERPLSGGESHGFAVSLSADQLVTAVVDQRGIDLAVRVFAPDGRQLADVDREKRANGPETVTLIADAGGVHVVEIQAAQKNAPAGRYEITLDAPRSPNADERTLEEARRTSEIARQLRKGGKYDDALPLAERALALRERILGSDEPAVADALHLIAVILDDKHEYAKAEAPNLRALAIREKAFGPDHPDVARSLFNLAWLAKVRQDFANAESLYQRALDIQEKALGPDHPEVATTLNDFAVLQNQVGRFDQSIRLNERVLAIREKALGPEDDGVAKALNNLARGYENKGEFVRAGALLRRAITVWEKAFGPDHPEVAFALDGLARVSYTAGDYVAAEPLYLRALAIREKALGPDHTEVGTTLNNLAILYREKGDYAKAETLSRRDLAITENKLGPNHAFVAPTLSNLARTYEQQGDYERAEPLYRRALTIQETALGSNHASVGQTLARLGRLLVQKGDDPAEAEVLLKRAIVTVEKAAGPDHPVVAAALSGLGSLSRRKSDWREAERYYERALAAQESVYGRDHPEVAETLEQLAALTRSNGNPDRAVALLSRAYDIRERHLDHNLVLGSERQKLAFLKRFTEDTDRAVSLHASLAPRDPAALRLAFTALLNRKGRALDATVDNIAALRFNASPEDRLLFDRLSAARSHLASVTLRGPSGAGAAYQRQLVRMRDEVDRLEGEVSARSAAFRGQSRSVSLDAVRAAIPDGAVLVEFTLYRPIDEPVEGRRLPRYAVYLLEGRGEARWVDLGEAASIDRAIEAWRQALADPGKADVNQRGRRVHALVMEPWRALVGSKRQLLIAPDGALNLIPFAALVDSEQQSLIERYTITYLTSGRDLLRLQVPRASRNEAVVVAAPAFGEPAMIPASRAEPLSARTQERPRVDYSQVFFGSLPGVAGEVRALKTLLPRATFLIGDRATEAALRRIAGPRILHIATHGFVLADAPGKGAAGQPPPGASTRIGKWAAWADNPLLRSGLALSGANQGRSGSDDGVLTALEAAGLDLWGTKLVVLSACDTGIGEVKNGDGVYGLRRALVLAGSESQLMSLWRVSDRSTRDLMIEYYRRLLRGAGRSEALREAQQQVRRRQHYRHPYYWASFIQSGEWANLDGTR